MGTMLGFPPWANRGHPVYKLNYLPNWLTAFSTKTDLNTFNFWLILD